MDPLGLSYDDDDPQTIDPRDQMNPGLVRITNGEDLFTNVSALTEEQQIAVYNNMMLDPRWSKFMLQSGFKRSATPLYWQIGQLHQDYYPGATVNLPHIANGTLDSTAVEKYYNTGVVGAASQTPKYYVANESDPRGFFQTGHRGKMGWIPTDALISYATNDGFKEQPAINAMPSVQCITCCFPKMYKTLYYYRMFITETVYLSGLKNTGINAVDDPIYGQLERRGLDNFVGVQYPYPVLPGELYSIGARKPSTPNDGEMQ